MKKFVFAFLLLSALCVSAASAQSKCGQTIALRLADFTFCTPAGWTQQPRDPQQVSDDFRGPAPGHLLNVASNYGDQDLKKQVDHLVKRNLEATGGSIKAISLASRTAFKSASDVPGEKIVYSVTIEATQFLFVEYVFKTGLISHADLTWIIPAGSPASLLTQIDASMAAFKLKAK